MFVTPFSNQGGVGDGVGADVGGANVGTVVGADVGDGGLTGLTALAAKTALGRLTDMITGAAQAA